MYIIFFKSAVQSALMKSQQEVLQLPGNVFLRHLSSRWLTLGPAVDRLIEQFAAVRSVVMSDSACRVGGQLRQRLRKSFSDRALYAKLLFIKNAADIFIEFLCLFQRSEPLVHVLYSEIMALVFKLWGHFMTKESYCTKKGTELPLFQVDSPTNWKAKVEIGEDTEQEISSWEAGDKRISTSVEDHWKRIFDDRKSDNGAKYPLLSKIVKALLCIPHGNADVERGFSVNRRQLNERSRLIIQTMNGIRNIVSYAKRFGSDPCNFDVTPDVVRAVRGASKRYRDRLAAEEEQAAKRQRIDGPKTTPSEA